MFYNLTTKRPGASWRDRLEEIKGARAEYYKNLNIMTPFERVLIEKSVSEKVKEVEPYILEGAIGEWHYALNNYQKAIAQVQEAKNREVSRWDASKLNAEMQSAEMLIKKAIESSVGGGSLEPSVMPRIEAMYQDAQRSGDIYKQRAMAEVATSLTNMVGDDMSDRMRANRIAQQAQRDAQAVRTTAELERAHITAKEAVESINHAREVLSDVDAALGRTLPNGEIGHFDIFREVCRVKTDARGNIKAIVPLDQALQQPDQTPQ